VKGGTARKEALPEDAMSRCPFPSHYVGENGPGYTTEKGRREIHACGVKVGTEEAMIITPFT